MTTDNKAIEQASGLQMAKADKVTNVTSIEPVLPSYGGAKVPVCVVFHQERMKPLNETYEVEQPELRTKEVIQKDGSKKMEVETEAKEQTINGKKVIVYLPIETGKMIRVKKRFKVDELQDNRQMDFYFECSDAKELRHKIGQAFNELGKALVTKKHPFTRDTLNVTLKMEGKVLSTKSLLYGGVKLSKVFYKGNFNSDMFGTNLCAPLFQQLQDVEKGVNNKPLAVSDTILTAVGLKSVETK